MLIKHFPSCARHLFYIVYRSKFRGPRQMKRSRWHWPKGCLVLKGVNDNKAKTLQQFSLKVRAVQIFCRFLRMSKPDETDQWIETRQTKRPPANNQLIKYTKNLSKSLVIQCAKNLQIWIWSVKNLLSLWYLFFVHFHLRQHMVLIRYLYFVIIIFFSVYSFPAKSGLIPLKAARE